SGRARRGSRGRLARRLAGLARQHDAGALGEAARGVALDQELERVSPAGRVTRAPELLREIPDRLGRAVFELRVLARRRSALERREEEREESERAHLAQEWVEPITPSIGLE